MRWFGIIAEGLLEALISLGCYREVTEKTELASPVDDPVWFCEDSDKVGLSFQYEASPIGRYFMPQIMGHPR